MLMKRSIWTLIAPMIAAIMIITPASMFASSGSTTRGVHAVTTLGAEILELGERQVTYTISNMGESYLKDSSIESMGRHGPTPGLSEWWSARQIHHGDIVVHNALPYSVLRNPNSMYNTYSGVDHIGFGQYGFCTLSVNAYNLHDLATGPGKDPLFLPILGAPNGIDLDGGFVNLQWYLTYLTTSDLESIYAGVHYANSYYGVSMVPPLMPIGDFNDGFLLEHQGHMDFDRVAAKKYLGLPATGDLRDEFNASNSAGALNSAWKYHYEDEGADGAVFDTTACYDYPVSAVYCRLSVDPESTPNWLKLRIWSMSWGVEYLMTRYLDALGLMRYHQTSIEDWYLNATLTSEGGSIQSSMTAVYSMLSWTDPNAWAPAWAIEASHLDRAYDEIGWTSRYNPYDAYSASYDPARVQYVPGTTNFGQEVAFWNTPMNWDLDDSERLVVELGKTPFLGCEPFVGTVPDDLDAYGPQKAEELNGHQVWGELVLGSCFPESLRDVAFYDSLNKTLTVTGPFDFQGNPNPEYPLLNETGSPMIVLSVSRVSTYDLRMVEPGPWMVGETYTLEVTAKNYSGETVTDWNGTVHLSIAEGGAQLGSSAITFTPADNGVVTTTVEFTMVGDSLIFAEDAWFPLDVMGGLTIAEIDIPEFPKLLIPLLCVVTAVVIFRKREGK